MSCTPGEWQYEPDAEYVYGYDEKARHMVIADDVHHRNGPLIAAAPELLEALRECLADLETHALKSAVMPHTNERMRRARAAITKAEGRS
jgi:hypothetical protein